MFRFKDLSPNKKDSARLIELMAPLHALAEMTMPRTLAASDKAIKDQIDKLRQLRANSKSEEEKKKLGTYRDRVMIKKLKSLDMKLKDIDFDIYIEVAKVGMNVTGNANFYELSNQRLLEVGLL